jgi:hypothetical protein
MGADMSWHEDRGVLVGLRKGDKLEIPVGDRLARANDKMQQLEQPAFVSQGRTYAPLKFLADGMHYMISMEKGNYVLRPVRN